jgi:hypothetical protein
MKNINYSYVHSVNMYKILIIHKNEPIKRQIVCTMA